MPRRDAGNAAVHDLADALAALGAEVDVAEGGSDLVIREPGGHQIPLIVKPATVLSTTRAPEFLVRAAKGQRGGYAVVVADEISKGARALLNQEGIGWLDRRGHLRLWDPPLMIDADVPAIPRAGRRTRSTGPIRGLGGLAYAVGVLLASEEPPTLTDLARGAGLAISSVSEAASVIRRAGLVRSDGTPVLPELFEAVAEVWEPGWQWLGEEPKPGDAKRTAPLELGLEDVHEPGWALTDSRAAIGWGARLVASSAYPPALYVPVDRQLRRAVDLYGVGTPSETRGARVAVAPLPMVCRPRYAIPGETWPGTHPLFVALDLTRDPARGAEALQEWDPPSPFRRVW